MTTAYFTLKQELLRPKLEELLPNPDHVSKAMLFAQWLRPVYGMRKDFLPDGYYNVEAKRLEKLFGRDYADLRNALLGSNGIADVYNNGMYFSAKTKNSSNQLIKSKDNYAMAYKLKEEYLTQCDTLLAEVKVPHADKVAKYIKKDLDKRTQEFDARCKRLALTQMTRRICRNLDNERAWQDASVLEQRGQVFINRGKQVQLATLVNRLDWLVEGNFYGNSQDDNGRKHDPLTNSWELIKRYMRIDGKPVVEMDFSNSQYYFLALLIKYPTECYAVLTEQAKDDKDAVREVLMTMRELHDAEPVVQEFCRQALAGTLYEWAAAQSNSTRDSIKRHFQAAFMSETSECLVAKRKLKFIKPLLDVLGKLNGPSEEDNAYWYKVAEANEDLSYKLRKKMRESVYKPMKRNYVSQLLQRFESRMIVDRISMAAVDYCADPFQSVHDSFLSSAADQATLKELTELKFDELGILAEDQPKIKTKQFEPGYVFDATTEELANVPKHYVTQEEARVLIKDLQHKVQA